MVRPIIKWSLSGLLIAVIALLILLCNADPSADYDKKHPPTSKKTATIILIDGLSQEIFQSELSKGHFPNIEKLMPRSLYIENGISSFPSMTGYAFYPFITGMDAAESGIYGLRWLDRSRDEGNLRNYVGRTNVHMNHDVRNDVQNAFELYDTFYTASINTYMNRGVNHSVKTGWAHTTAKYAQHAIFPYLRSFPYFGKKIAKNHFQHETLVTDLAIEQLAKNPKVQWITYPSPDAHNHVHGTDSTYYKLLRHIDKQVGRIIETTVSLNQNDRLIAIVSDHGISDVDVNLDIVELFDKGLNLNLERGPSTHIGTDRLDTPIESFLDKDGYFVINGNLSAYLYMKDSELIGKESWRKKLNAEKLEDYRQRNIPAFISNLKGIDLVACAINETQIKVLKNGYACIFQQLTNGKYNYSCQSADPLYPENILHPDSAYTNGEILEKTHLTAYPYALPRLFNLLMRPDGPDLVMTSLPGYDLASDYEIFVSNYKGGHGGIRSELLRVPYILYIPNEKGRKINSLLAEEAGEIIMDYLKDE